MRTTLYKFKRQHVHQTFLHVPHGSKPPSEISVPLLERPDRPTTDVMATPEDWELCDEDHEPQDAKVIAKVLADGYCVEPPTRYVFITEK